MRKLILLTAFLFCTNLMCQKSIYYSVADGEQVTLDGYIVTEPHFYSGMNGKYW